MTDDRVATEEALDAPQNDEQAFMARLKETISVDIEDIGTLRRKMTITVPEGTINERRSNQFGELKRDSVVPGFRKGHAPMRLIEKRFGSDVNNQLSSQVLSSSYLAAVEKEDIKIVGDPLVWATNTKKPGDAARLVSVQEAFELVDLPKNGDFHFACEVELHPEFELPELTGLQLTEPDLKVDDEQVDAAVERLRAMRGQFAPCDGPIQEDDLVVCHFKAMVGERVIEEEDNCQLAARAMRYSSILMEELGKDVTGKQVGATVKTAGVLSDEYPEEALRNQKAVVEITVKDIKRFEMPELGTELLSAFGCESVDELRDGVRNELESSLSEEVRSDQRRQVSDHLVETVEMELPSGMSERQTERLVARRMLDLARRGMPESEVLKKADALRTGATEDAIRDLKLFFIFEKIGEQWDIEVTEEEINGQIAAIAARQNRRFDRVRDDLMRNNNLSALYLHVRDDKIIERIIAEANISPAAGDKPKKSKAPAKKTTKKD